MDPTPATDRPQRILLLENSRPARDELRGVLAERRSLVCAADVREGRRLLQEEGPFALMVVDHATCGQQGLELLEETRQKWPEMVRVVLACGAGPELDPALLEECDVFSVLVEPCSPERLRAVVDGALELHAGRQRHEREADELHFNYESLAGFNAALEARIFQQTHALSRLHQFAVDLNRAETILELVELAAEAAHEILDGRGVHVQVWDPEHVKVEAGRGPEMSWCMHSEPLRTMDGQVGELVVDQVGPAGEGLSNRQCELLASIASSAAVAVHNELRRRERDQAQQATILAMARLSEQRDSETGQHIERVSSYCELIARGLREDGHFEGVITDKWIDDLVRSAPLHDIGKVGIPDSILLKPGKLTPEEWIIMKTHTEIGGATLDAVRQQYGGNGFLGMGRDIALCHHERWDGTGYPAGLSGDAIPLSARIVALADVYDALTTVRPYKDAWTHEASIAWIREGRGKHFDPRIVDAFVAREAEASEIRVRLADDDDDPGLQFQAYARSA